MRMSPAWTLLLAISLPQLAAQDHKPDPVAVSVKAWLESDMQDRTLLEKASKKILDSGKSGYLYLAEQIEKAPADNRNPKAGLNSLITHTALGYMEAQAKSGMVYAGQYDELRVLQPYVGRFYLTLVLDTPDWFPDDQRVLVIPALRDLFPKGPDRDIKLQLRSISEDEEFESEGLRISIAYALAQWGDRELIADRLDTLRKNAGESKNTEELHFTRELANLHYNLRDYREGSKIWLRYLRGREALKIAPSPADYYNAGCNLSLSGQIKAALAELENSARCNADPDLDESFRLEKSLFLGDPDLRAVRMTRQFERLVKVAFPKSGEKKNGKDG